MRKVMTLLVGLVLLSNSLIALNGYVEGTEHVCLTYDNTQTYYWSEAAFVTGEVVTYTVKDRSGNTIESTDVAQSVNAGVLNLTIYKNHFDILITMKVVHNGVTQYFSKKVQVGVGDELTADMVQLSNSSPRCGSSTWITVEVDKQDVYGVDFLWTFPTGWVQQEGGLDNYVTVEPDGIHDGNITVQMRVYGDEFCFGDEIEDYLGPVVSKPIVLITPDISIVEPASAGVPLTYNSQTPITFTASSFASSGHTYHWSLPCGWTSPAGESGSFVSTTSSVQITPSGFTGPGEKVKVRALLNCAGTPTYSDYAEWDLVWNSGEAPVISGASIVCSDESTFTLSSIPNGATVTWTNSSNLTYVRGQNTTEYVVVGTSTTTSGPGLVEATITRNGCSAVLSSDELMVSSFPSQPIIRIPIESDPLNCNYDALIWADATPNDLSFDWEVVSNGTIVSEDYDEIIVSIDCPTRPRSNWLIVKVRVNNVCGSLGYTTRSIDVTDEGTLNPLSVYPNPADIGVTVNLTGLFAGQETGEAQLYLYNSKNEVVYEKVTSDQNLVIPTTNIMDGIYHLKAYYLDKTFQRHIVIKH